MSRSLGGLVRSAINRAPYVRVLVRRLRHFERFCPLDHFYSPIPNLDELIQRDAQIFRNPGPELAGIDLNLPAQIALLRELGRFASETNFPQQAAEGRRYHAGNDFFGLTDATFLHCLIRHLQPRRIVEVGSGFSSCVTLDAVQTHLAGKVECTFIDPDPQRLRTRLLPGDLERITLVPGFVQDVGFAPFDELGENDILFIDSSHVAKAGSDVNHLFFEVLPRLKPGVLVHVHDIFYPFEYPKQWIYEGRSWNEAYLLRAFLQHNTTFVVTCFPSYLQLFAADELKAALPGTEQVRGQSLWMKKIR